MCEKTAQVHKPEDPATRRLLDALRRAADVACRLAEGDFETEAVAPTGRPRHSATELRVDGKQLSRAALLDHSEDLACIAVAIQDISKTISCEHCGWLAQFAQGRHPVVWGLIVEITGGRELDLPARKKRPGPDTERALQAVAWRSSPGGLTWDQVADKVGYADGDTAREAVYQLLGGDKVLRRAGRHAGEEVRWAGSIGSAGRILVKASWGRRHLQGRHVKGVENANRRGELDSIVRTERPPNWANEVQLCAADLEPAREFVAHVAGEGIRHVKSEMAAVWLTLPHADDRFVEVPILEFAPIRRVLALASRRWRDKVTNRLVHHFLAELLETTPGVVANQLRKDLTEFPSLPTVQVGIE